MNTAWQLSNWTELHKEVATGLSACLLCWGRSRNRLSLVARAGDSGVRPSQHWFVTNLANLISLYAKLTHTMGRERGVDAVYRF